MELARRGHRVDLYDRGSEPVTQASFWNEGKIHLGLVYANDPTGRTHETMLRGALHFVPYLARWLDGPVTLERESFDYAVHRTSLLSVERIAAHFARVEACYDAMSEGLGLRYPGIAEQPFAVAMNKHERDDRFDPGLIVMAYRTAERVANPRSLAARLRAAIAAEPRIAFMGDTFVTGVRTGDQGRIGIESRCDGQVSSAIYDHVVNALWAGRLEIDRSGDVAYRRSWLYRTKLGLLLPSQTNLPSVPSVTFVLGSYGDTVRYDDGTLYLSWYPDCMIGSSSDLVSPDFIADLDETARAEIAEASLAALTALLPSLAPYRAQLCKAQVGGGVIAAWGDAGIEDPASELHRRYDIGVSSYGRYHSVDTGKYTMAPLFAVETCDRIEGAI